MDQNPFSIAGELLEPSSSGTEVASCDETVC